MSVIERFGGLWFEDVFALLEEGKARGYEVNSGLEPDHYHYFVEWRTFP